MQHNVMRIIPVIVMWSSQAVNAFFFFFYLMYSGRKAVFNKAFKSIALVEYKRDIYRHCIDPESIGFIYVCIHISTGRKVLQ